MYKTIIDANTLVLHLNNPDYWIVDCRFNLADTSYGQKAYTQNHIPSAYYLHLDHDLSSPITPQSGRHPLPDLHKLAATLTQLGLRQDSQVIVYDDSAGAMAVRLWWLLRWLGHEAVAVLDGGFPAWQQQQLPVTQVIPDSRPAANFKPNVQADFIVETRDLLSEHTWQLVDARAAERFRGEMEPIDPIAGHIPGAINRPLTDNLINGRFKTAIQLKAEWQQILGDINPHNVVHMCGSGVTACHNQLAMEMAGLNGSRLYAGSWSEWIRDLTRPRIP